MRRGADDRRVRTEQARAAEFAKLRERLRHALERAAEWRRRRSEEHPDDRRNIEAACDLDALARRVDQVPPELLQTYCELLEDMRDAEAHSEMLQMIGLNLRYSSGDEVKEPLSRR